MPKDKCPTKWKERLTHAQATAQAEQINARLHYKAQEAYKCGDHWHTGNGRVKRHKQALKRGRASGRIDAKGRRRRK